VQLAEADEKGQYEAGYKEYQDLAKTAAGSSGTVLDGGRKRRGPPLRSPKSALETHIARMHGECQSMGEGFLQQLRNAPPALRRELAAKLGLENPSFYGQEGLSAEVERAQKTAFESKVIPLAMGQPQVLLTIFNAEIRQNRLGMPTLVRKPTQKEKKEFIEKFNNSKLEGESFDPKTGVLTIRQIAPQKSSTFGVQWSGSYSVNIRDIRMFPRPSYGSFGSSQYGGQFRYVLPQPRADQGAWKWVGATEAPRAFEKYANQALAAAVETAFKKHVKEQIADTSAGALMLKGAPEKVAEAIVKDFFGDALAEEKRIALMTLVTEYQKGINDDRSRGAESQKSSDAKGRIIDFLANEKEPPRMDDPDLWEFSLAPF
jgi:hypothetical protein